MSPPHACCKFLCCIHVLGLGQRPAAGPQRYQHTSHLAYDLPKDTLIHAYLHERICNRSRSGSDGTLHGLTATLVLPRIRVSKDMPCKPLPLVRLLETPKQRGHRQL